MPHKYVPFSVCLSARTATSPIASNLAIAGSVPKYGAAVPSSMNTKEMNCWSLFKRVEGMTDSTEVE